MTGVTFSFEVSHINLELTHLSKSLTLASPASCSCHLASSQRNSLCENAQIFSNGRRDLIAVPIVSPQNPPSRLLLISPLPCFPSHLGEGGAHCPCNGRVRGHRCWENWLRCPLIFPSQGRATGPFFSQGRREKGNCESDSCLRAGQWAGLAHAVTVLGWVVGSRQRGERSSHYCGKYVTLVIIRRAGPRRSLTGL